MHETRQSFFQNIDFSEIDNLFAKISKETINLRKWNLETLRSFSKKTDLSKNDVQVQNQQEDSLSFLKVLPKEQINSKNNTFTNNFQSITKYDSVGRMHTSTFVSPRKIMNNSKNGIQSRSSFNTLSNNPTNANKTEFKNKLETIEAIPYHNRCRSITLMNKVDKKNDDLSKNNSTFLMNDKLKEVFEMLKKLENNQQLNYKDFGKFFENVLSDSDSIFTFFCSFVEKNSLEKNESLKIRFSNIQRIFTDILNQLKNLERRAFLDVKSGKNSQINIQEESFNLKRSFTKPSEHVKSKSNMDTKEILELYCDDKIQDIEIEETNKTSFRSEINCFSKKNKISEKKIKNNFDDSINQNLIEDQKLVDSIFINDFQNNNLENKLNRENLENKNLLKKKNEKEALVEILKQKLKIIFLKNAQLQVEMSRIEVEERENVARCQEIKDQNENMVKNLELLEHSIFEKQKECQKLNDEFMTNFEQTLQIQSKEVKLKEVQTKLSLLLNFLTESSQNYSKNSQTFELKNDQVEMIIKTVGEKFLEMKKIEFERGLIAEVAQKIDKEGFEQFIKFSEKENFSEQNMIFEDFINKFYEKCLSFKNRENFSEENERILEEKTQNLKTEGVIKENSNQNSPKAENFDEAVFIKENQKSLEVNMFRNESNFEEKPKNLKIVASNTQNENESSKKPEKLNKYEKKESVLPLKFGKIESKPNNIEVAQKNNDFSGSLKRSSTRFGDISLKTYSLNKVQFDVWEIISKELSKFLSFVIKISSGYSNAASLITSKLYKESKTSKLLRFHINKSF